MIAFCLFENIFKGCEIKNAIRDGGSTALYTALTIYFVNTDYNIETCLLLLLLYTAKTLNSSMYAYIYCYGRLECYWNGQMGF